MTNKRFTTDNGSNEDVCLVDNVTGNEYESNFEDIVELLNELYEANMILKGEVAHYKLILMSLEEQAKRLSKIHCVGDVE